MGLFGGGKVDVQVSLTGGRVAPGERVGVRVDVGKPDGKVRGGRVDLLYRNTYRDVEVEADDDREERREVTRTDEVLVASVPLWDGAPQEGLRALDVALPEDAPPTVPGMVAWEVRAVVDRKMGADGVAEHPLDVTPSEQALRSWAERSPRVEPGSPLAITAEPRVLRPGDRVAGTVTLRAGSEEVSGRSLRVELVRRRREQSGIEDEQVTATVPLEHDVALQPGERREVGFSLEVPAAATPSARADRNEQHWHVRAVLDRKLRADPTADVEVVVLG
jgi:sporulation-control protein spo0M